MHPPCSVTATLILHYLVCEYKDVYCNTLYTELVLSIICSVWSSKYPPCSVTATLMLHLLWMLLVCEMYITTFVLNIIIIIQQRAPLSLYGSTSFNAQTSSSTILTSLLYHPTHVISTLTLTIIIYCYQESYPLFWLIWKHLHFSQNYL